MIRRTAGEVLNSLEARVASLESRTKTSGLSRLAGPKSILGNIDEIAIESMKNFASKGVIKYYVQEMQKQLQFQIQDLFVSGKGLSPKRSLGPGDVAKYNLNINSSNQWTPSGTYMQLEYYIGGDVTLKTGEVLQVMLEAYFKIPMVEVKVRG